MAIQFIKFTGPAGMFFAKMIDSHGIMILQCRGCQDVKCYSDCVTRIRRAAAYDTNFERSSTHKGQWFFNIRETGGDALATSRMHNTSFEMEQSISAAKTLAMD